MASVEELLKLIVYTQSNALTHLLYKTYGPTYIDFLAGSVTIELDPDESTTVIYTVPVDKVKIPAFFKWTFEAQRKFDVLWSRDGRVFVDASSMVDWEMIPPYGYEAWYPIKNSYSAKITNNDSVARSFTATYTYYLIEKKMYEEIDRNLKEAVKALSLKV